VSASQLLFNLPKITQQWVSNKQLPVKKSSNKEIYEMKNAQILILFFVDKLKIIYGKVEQEVKDIIQ
jgi:hypothetical protein